jgi:hypothetical protein
MFKWQQRGHVAGPFLSCRLRKKRGASVLPATRLLRDKRKSQPVRDGVRRADRCDDKTIFSQVVVTAACAGLVTDRKIKRKRGEPLIWKYVCPFPRCLVVLEAEQLNRQNIKRANVSCAVEINHLPILY